MVIKPIAYSCYMIYKITIIILLCYTISFTIIGHCGKPWAIPNRRRHRSSAAFQANRREPVSEVIPQRKFDPKLWENEEFLSGSQPFLDVRQKRRNWAWAIAIFLKRPQQNLRDDSWALLWSIVWFRLHAIFLGVDYHDARWLGAVDTIKYWHDQW